MFKFIKVITEVIEQQLSNDIILSSIDFYVRDQIYHVRVTYYTKNFIKMGFSYGYYESQQERPEMMEWSFVEFLKRNFREVLK